MWERGNSKPVKSNDVNDGGSSIPPEIEGIVISNLPTMSLLRFQCVSKSWRHMIPDLCATMFQKSMKSNPSNCIIGTVGKGFNCPYSLLKLKNGRLEHQELKLELGHDISLWRVRCSCNGLVLLTVRYRNIKGIYYILWNPSIRKWRKILFPVRGLDEYNRGHGICYDPISGGFKIICLSNKRLLVYSCKSSTWSSKDCTSDRIFLEIAVCTDGAVYWSTQMSSGIGSAKYLLKFDSKDDQLRSIQMPECVGQIWGTQYLLSTLRDTLYVWYVRKAERLIGLWVLNEDHSWMKLMNITYELPGTPWGIWFVNDGNDILINTWKRKYQWRLHTCNLANKVFTSNLSYFCKKNYKMLFQWIHPLC